MTPDSERFLLVGAGLFILGAVGFLTRRNLILMILSAELMLHGVSLTLVTFGRMHQTNEGQAFTIFTLTVAACEAGLALSLVLSLYRKAHSLDIQVWSEMREDDLPGPSIDPPEAERLAGTEYDNLPTLTPAGVVPEVSLQVTGSAAGVKSSPI